MHMHQLMYTHTHCCLQKHSYKCTRTHMHTHTHSLCWFAWMLVCAGMKMDGTVTSWTTVPAWILQIVLGSRRNRNPDTRSLVLNPLHCSLLNYVDCKRLNPLGQVSSPARWRRGRRLNPLGVKTQFFDKHEQWFQSLEGSSSNPRFIWGISFIWKLCFLSCYSGEPCQPVGLSGD